MTATYANKFLLNIEDDVRRYGRKIVFFTELYHAGFTPETAQGLLIGQGLSVERRHNAQALIITPGVKK